MKVVIVEDQGMLRGALAALLNMEKDIEVIAQADNGRDGLDLIRRYSPDLCLLDIEMPLMSGIEVAEVLQREQALPKVVILTTFARQGYFERAMQAGVSGYLLKDSPVEELARALRDINKGKKVIDPDLALSACCEPNPLTEREQDILKEVAQGKTNQAIASTLFLSHGTVRNYLSRILGKLNAQTRGEAVRIAREKGWVDSEIIRRKE